MHQTHTFTTIIRKNLRSTLFGALGMILVMGPLQLRAQLEEDQWSRSQTAGGRIRVVARDAALMQSVSVWAARSLTDLEREWGLSIPFQSDHPLILLGSDRVGEVTLQQEVRQGNPRQRILIPEPMEAADSRSLARIFTRALAVRLIVAAVPRETTTNDVHVPAWLEIGSATRLMGDRQGVLYGELTAVESIRPPSYPEEIVRRKIGDPTPRAEAEAALLCRWLFGRSGVTPSQHKELWTSIAGREPLDVATLLRMGGGSRDLRDFHQHWDLWWQNERFKLMAEFRLSGSVMKALREELRFVPGFYGLYREDADRTRVLGFDQLEGYVDDSAFAGAMAKWSLRLQPLRFRQSEEINDLIARFQQAISTLASASREKGKARQTLWTEAVNQWDQAREMLKEYGEL